MQMLQHVANSTHFERKRKTEMAKPKMELEEQEQLRREGKSLQLPAKLQHLIDFHSTFIFGCDAAVATTVAQVFNDFGQV